MKAGGPAFKVSYSSVVSYFSLGYLTRGGVRRYFQSPVADYTRLSLAQQSHLTLMPTQSSSVKGKTLLLMIVWDETTGHSAWTLCLFFEGSAHSEEAISVTPGES